MLEKIKYKIFNFIKLILKPDKPHYSNLFFVIFGLKIIRIILHRLVFLMKGFFYRKQKLSERMNVYFKKIDDNGILAIENFFDQKTFKKVLNSSRDILNKVEVNNFRNKGAIIKTKSIEKMTVCEKENFIYKTFSENKIINELVSKVMRTKIFEKPRVVIQELHIPNGRKDGDDTTRVLHADRYFDHIKLFFYLDDQNENSGAYIFAPTSHKFNLYRLIHEYEIDLRYLFRRIKFFLNKEKKILYPDVHNTLKKRMNIQPKQQCFKKNTMIITNNHGFHSRGLMKSGHKRYQIRVQFQYLAINPIQLFMFKILKNISLNIFKKGIRLLD